MEMTFAEKWALWWFGIFFAIAFFDIFTGAIPLPSVPVCFILGMLVGFGGVAPMIFSKEY